MRQSYVEESYVATKLKELLPTGTRILERGKSNSFSEDILVIHTDGTEQKYEVKSLKFMSLEQSLYCQDGKYRSYDGSVLGKYTQIIIDYIEKNNIKVGSNGIEFGINKDVVIGYIKEQLLKRGNDKLVVSDSKSNRLKIFDLHTPFDLDIEDYRFSLRNKPSGTHKVISGTSDENKCIQLLDNRNDCTIIRKDERVYVKFKENPKTKKIELSPEFIASLRDDDTYELRKRSSASVINLTPYITVSAKIFD